MPITGSTAQQISHSEFGFTTLVALFISGFSTTEELLWPNGIQISGTLLQKGKKYQ
jgi:hypothetical protein